LFVDLLVTTVWKLSITERLAAIGPHISITPSTPFVGSRAVLTWFVDLLASTIQRLRIIVCVIGAGSDICISIPYL
jgi:hypothetical protein